MDLKLKISDKLAGAMARRVSARGYTNWGPISGLLDDRAALLAALIAVTAERDAERERAEHMTATAEAEAHIVNERGQELYAADASTEELESEIAALRAERDALRDVSSITVGAGLTVSGSFEAIRRVQNYILLDSKHPVESADVRRSLAKALQLAETELVALRAERDAANLRLEDPAIQLVAAKAYDAERCRLNELWHGGKCELMSETALRNVAPMIVAAVKATVAAMGAV